MIRSLLCALAVAAGVAGCQSSGSASRAERGQFPPLPPSTAGTGGLSEEELRGAARLYVVKCARCHKFYNPADYDDERWHFWMTKMSRKARLQRDQQELLSHYLELFRTAPKNGGKRHEP